MIHNIIFCLSFQNDKTVLLAVTSFTQKNKIAKHSEPRQYTFYVLCHNYYRKLLFLE